MIRLWISRKTATPVHDQLVGQFILGILSRRLVPGEKLPSVRELARRLKLHPNTVSAVYRSLADGGWVAQRRGSGVFVRHSYSSRERETADAFVQSCLQEGLARGYSAPVLRSAFLKWANQPKEDFVVVDPDPELARILATEIAEATGSTIPSMGYREVGSRLSKDAGVLITERFARTNPPLLRVQRTRIIQLKSMQDVLLGHERPGMPILVATVSRSELILRWAGTLLSALGFSPDTILLRNPQCEGWRDGLSACHVIATDVVSAREFIGAADLVVFRIVSDGFLRELTATPVAESLISRHSVDDPSRSS